jgi:hypothetical protein
MKIRMKLVAFAAAITATLALGAGPALAAGNGNGGTFKDCFGVNYGQSGLNYGQLKQDAPHPLAGGYGLPGVLAAHGPDGVAPLCSAS